MSLLTHIYRRRCVFRHAARHARARRKQESDDVAGISVDAVPAALCRDRRGFFTQEGLDLNQGDRRGADRGVLAVMSGSAHFSIHGPEWTAVAAEKGAEVDVIANVVNGAAVWIATAPDFKFDSIKDVKGQKVVTGQMPTTWTSLFFRLLKENGMSPATSS